MADIFQNLDELDDEALRKVADRLEYRGTYPPFVAMRDRYFDRLPMGSFRNVLDMGCGTGVVTRALAARLGRDARLVGSDFSAELVAVARRLAEAEGLGGRIDFAVADSHATEDDAGVFDLVVMHTLISHVTDPASVLAEATRLATPGGYIAVFDGDYASITLGAGDPALNDRALVALLKTVVAHPRAMRRFPELVRPVGLEIVDFLPEVLAEVGTAEFFASMIDSYAPAMIAAGNLDAEAAEAWAQTHNNASANETFFGSCNFATFILRKPD